MIFHLILLQSCGRHMQFFLNPRQFLSAYNTNDHVEGACSFCKDDPISRAPISFYERGIFQALCFYYSSRI